MVVLNNGQEKIVKEAVEHIKSGNLEPFEISGEAGTGKSVTLNEIVNRLGIDRNRIAPMSYIGAAAIVMRLKGFSNAKTIHSWIYNAKKIDAKDAYGKSINYDPYFGISEANLKFLPKPLDNIDLIIIDEGGSAPFRIRRDIESYNIPTLVAGDLNQLPPVADDPAYLFDRNKVHFLTEIMRQKANSGILHIAHRALEGLPIHNGYYGDAIVIYDDQVTNDMFLQSDIVLCGTNNTRDRLNKVIREEILGFKGKLPRCGEKIICRRNDWSISVDGIGLGNGLIGKVVNNPEVINFDGRRFYLDFKPDLFNGIFTDLDIDFEYFNALCTKKNELKNRKWNYGHLFDYAYCITTHLSQGSQFANVMYFEEPTSSLIQNKLNYTGVTRASNGLIYVKRKKIYSFN